MNCCEDYNDLGCVGSCTKEIRLGDSKLDSKNLSDFHINVIYPGLCSCYEIRVDDYDYLVIKTDKLNEDYTHKIILYYQSVIQECFKIKIMPEICQ